ncbi:amino acid racemase [Afifella sp. JA880]|uniref:aspartate/glutamate racemase family protein n=1 Tax=Afifella sp. JA880 TaxID=2975280 RepID=UPI0021BB8133|nr:amino acid racemase [Afifella sp. JA880]MCT8266631.1 amino acid racemase [Afifella sp. JA880]
MTTRPLTQKTIGVLGGSSNIATGHYYRFLNEIVNARLGGWDIAETVIVGMNFGNIEAFLHADDWASLEAYMAKKVDALIAAGADVIVGVSNTLHKPMEAILASRDIDYIHIVDPTGEAIRKAGLKRVALFGTRPIMEMDYARRRYEEKFGLEIVVPNSDERAEIDRIIFDELVKDVIRPQSKARYLEIAGRLAREEGAEGLILGCTEIFLLIDQKDRPDFPMFNTTRLHCEAAVDYALTNALEAV